MSSDIGTIVEYNAGDVIVKQGQIARGLYALLSGELDVIVDGVMVARIVDKGAFVGEIASLLGGVRTATVVANTAATLLYVKQVTEYFENHPAALLSIARTLAGRIIEMDQKIVSVGKMVSEWIESLANTNTPEEVLVMRDEIVQMHSSFVRQANAGK